MLTDILRARLNYNIYYLNYRFANFCIYPLSFSLLYLPIIIIKCILKQLSSYKL